LAPTPTYRIDRCARGDLGARRVAQRRNELDAERSLTNDQPALDAMSDWPDDLGGISPVEMSLTQLVPFEAG